MRFPRLSVWAFAFLEITFSKFGPAFATRDLSARASPLYPDAFDFDPEAEANPVLSLLQRHVTSIQRTGTAAAVAGDAAQQAQSNIHEIIDPARADRVDASAFARALHGPKVQKNAVSSTTTTTTTTSATTTTTDIGPDYLIVSSTTTGSIFSFNQDTAQASVLTPNAGSNPVGIALDHNQGYLYYTDPCSRQIVRYELSIRDGQVDLYDQQPVPIAMGVDAEYILVNDDGNILWTDSVDHSIYKMYKDTIELVASGSVQPNQLSIVSYMDIYLQIGKRVPSHCYSNSTVFPANCSENVTCEACQSLSQMPYIYKLYTDVGTPSGVQLMPGNKLLWGNLVDGFTRGTVVEADFEPRLAHNQTSFAPPRALTYLWDSVFNFYQMPNNSMGADTLFLTTNGTLGIPPIPGDVVGALIGITPGSINGPSEAIPMDWNFVRPRGLAWDGHDNLYIADDSGVSFVGTGRVLNDAIETPLFSLPGSSDLIVLKTSDPCYPLMVERGSEPLPSSFG